MYTATFYEPQQKCSFWFIQVRCAHKSGDVINFTIVACRISSRLKWYKNCTNWLRLAEVIVKNKMSRFYGSQKYTLHKYPMYWPGLNRRDRVGHVLPTSVRTQMFELANLSRHAGVGSNAASEREVGIYISLCRHYLTHQDLSIRSTMTQRKLKHTTCLSGHAE